MFSDENGDDDEMILVSKREYYDLINQISELSQDSKMYKKSFQMDSPFIFFTAFVSSCTTYLLCARPSLIHALSLNNYFNVLLPCLIMSAIVGFIMISIKCLPLDEMFNAPRNKWVLYSFLVLLCPFIIWFFILCNSEG